MLVEFPLNCYGVFDSDKKCSVVFRLNHFLNMTIDILALPARLLTLGLNMALFDNYGKSSSTFPCCLGTVANCIYQQDCSHMFVCFVSHHTPQITPQLFGWCFSPFCVLVEHPSISTLSNPFSTELPKRAFENINHRIIFMCQSLQSLPTAINQLYVHA